MTLIIVNLCNIHFSLIGKRLYIDNKLLQIVGKCFRFQSYTLFISCKQSSVPRQADRHSFAAFLPTDRWHYNADWLSFLSNTLKSHRAEQNSQWSLLFLLYKDYRSHSLLKMPIKGQYINIRVIKCFIFSNSHSFLLSWEQNMAVVSSEPGLLLFRHSHSCRNGPKF